MFNLLTKNDFGSDENEIIFITPKNQITFSQDTKEKIALKLVDAIKHI